MTAGRIVLGNTLLAGNGSFSCSDVGPYFESEGHNLCDLDASLLILPTLIEDNGQWVHPLLPSGPAVDIIPVEECGDEDQRGVTRPQNTYCDVGAYESDSVTMSAEEGVTLATATPTAQPAVVPEPPTINADALCWKGPGSLYEVVSSVKAGTEVMLLGQSTEGGWWVIDNPTYPGFPCWLSEDRLNLPADLDLTDLKLFAPPPPPTPTPTPIQGCLYQGPNDPEPLCYPINNCPVPFEQTEGACTP